MAAPTWEIIENKGGCTVEWKSFLEQPLNIFNDSFIDEKLDKVVSPRRQYKLIKGLNRLGAAFTGMVKKR